MRLAVPIILRGQQKVYTVILTVLFGAIICNLVISWIYLRTVTIANNDSRETMQIMSFLGVGARLTTATNVTCRITIFIADMIVVSLRSGLCGTWLSHWGLLQVWRCYTLWARSKMLLFMFTPLIATEAGPSQAQCF